MKITRFNEGIGELLKQYDLSKVKTFLPNTLFEVVDKSLLKEGKCIYCGNKLIVPRGKSIAMCRGRRHPERRPFIVKLETLNKIMR